MLIFLGSLALFLVAFFFAACNVSKMSDLQAEADIKKMMCDEAKDICNHKCDKCDECVWGKGDIK